LLPQLAGEYVYGGVVGAGAVQPIGKESAYFNQQLVVGGVFGGHAVLNESVGVAPVSFPRF
jgi:hypothetical protein